METTRETVVEKRARLSAELKELAPRTTPAEKMELALLNNLGLNTIYRYCRGIVGCVPVAEKILADLKRYVDKRDSVSAA